MKLALILTTALGFSNTLYPNKMTIWPSLELMHPINEKWEFILDSGVRATPTRLNAMNPLSGHWDVGVTYKLGNITFKLGHISEHGIGRTDYIPAESYDYFTIRYEVF